MMPLGLLGVALAMALLAWLGLHGLLRAAADYRRQFTVTATHNLGEFFLFLDPGQLWLLNLAVALGLLTCTYMLTQSIWLTGLAGGCALLAPRWIWSSLRKARLARLDMQLPDLLLALAGALRAGSSLQAALRHIVAQAPAPLSQEFSLMLREHRLGVPLDEALEHMRRRVPGEGMTLTVSALSIAAGSGGNLAETLERIAATLQSRLHLLGRVRALTSQGRLQAWVMAALPPLLAYVLDGLDPEAMAPLWSSWPGRLVAGGVAVLELAGVLLIRRIVQIRV